MGQIRPPKTAAEQQQHEQHLKAAVANFHPKERALLKFSENMGYSDLTYLELLAEDGAIELDHRAREQISLVMGNRGFVEGAPREIEIGIRATFEWQKFWGPNGFKFDHFDDIINLH